MCSLRGGEYRAREAPCTMFSIFFKQSIIYKLNIFEQYLHHQNTAVAGFTHSITIEFTYAFPLFFNLIKIFFFKLGKSNFQSETFLMQQQKNVPTVLCV